MADVRSCRRWRRFREEAYRRDRAANAPCWICGQPIDYLAKPGTPDAWEPDHYYPVRDHPELAYDMGNVRPAHCSCNRHRGAKVNTNKIGQRSRVW